MYSLVRKTLEVYLREKRIITQSDFPTDILSHIQSRESVFVTLYLDNRVGASSGRIDCKKENSVFECIDNTLLCLKDPRFSSVMQDATILDRIHIRVDRFMFRRKDGGTPYLRVLQKIGDLDIAHEGIIFLSQNLGLLSVILPHMVHIGSTPDAYFSLACKKLGLDPTKLNPSDYVIYGLTTIQESDFL